MSVKLAFRNSEGIVSSSYQPKKKKIPIMISIYQEADFTKLTSSLEMIGRKLQVQFPSVQYIHVRKTRLDDQQSRSHMMLSEAVASWSTV